MQPNPCTIQKIKNDMVASGEKGSPIPMGSSVADQPRGPKRSSLPLELMDIITPALRFGGLSALSGGVVGGFSGIVVSRTPILFAATTSIQWGLLGTTFWGTRVALLSRYHTPTQQEKSLSTTLASSIAGATGGLLRGRKNFLPGFFVFGAIGYLGQCIYDAVDRRKMADVNSGGTARGGHEKETWMRSKWVPWKALTDEEYEAMLREKLLRVNAEIALLDESLEGLKRQEKSITNRDGVNGKT